MMRPGDAARGTTGRGGPARDRGSSPLRWRAARWLLAAIFAGTGVLHFVIPRSYERIVPPWLPDARLLVVVSGMAEVLGAVGLLLGRVRRAAGIGLITLLVAVFPANVQMLYMAQADGAPAWRQTALWLRLPLQLVLVWWVWYAAIREPRGGIVRRPA